MARSRKLSGFGVRYSAFPFSLSATLCSCRPLTNHFSPSSVVLWAESHPLGSHSSIGLEVRDFLKQAVFAEFIVQR